MSGVNLLKIRKIQVLFFEFAKVRKKLYLCRKNLFMKNKPYTQKEPDAMCASEPAVAYQRTTIWENSSNQLDAPCCYSTAELKQRVLQATASIRAGRGYALEEMKSLHPGLR
jgi:hypothetical protein